MNSFYSEEELSKIGFKHYGKNVLISRYARFYGEENIFIGDNVRIDDYSILSGQITVGNCVHISAGCFLFGGKAGIVLEDYSGVSPRCIIHAESDDFSGLAMTNPMIPERFRNVCGQAVRLGRFVQVGSGCTILPGVTISEGTAVGCMSLINHDLNSWGIYAGIPCKRLKERKQDIILIEKELSEDSK